jgi:hypothetical protein
MCRPHRTLALALLAALTLRAQDPAPARPLAIMVERAITVSGEPIEDAAILIQDGKIAAIGPRASVDVPYEADVIEIPGLWATPGFIHVASLAMTPAGNYDLTGRTSAAEKLAVEDLVPSWQGVKVLAKAGFTRANVIVSKGGIAGRSVLVKPVARLPRPIRRDDVVAVEDLALSMGFEPRTSTKTFWKETLAKAKEHREARAAAEKDGGAGTGTDSAPASRAAPASRPAGESRPGSESRGAAESRPASRPKAPADDPKITPLADLLDSKRSGILDVAGAAGVLHLLPIVKDHPDFKPAVMLRGNDAWRVVDDVKKLGVPVILQPDRVFKPDTVVELVPVRDFVDAGVAVALIPETSFTQKYEGFVFHLAELVRKGVPREQVLRAVTLTPAEILGVEKELGSLEKGKAGDVLLWSSDPLSPKAALVRVIVGGVTVLDAGEEP